MYAIVITVAYPTRGIIIASVILIYKLIFAISGNFRSSDIADGAC